MYPQWWEGGSSQAPVIPEIINQIVCPPLNQPLYTSPCKSKMTTRGCIELSLCLLVQLTALWLNESALTGG